MIRSFRGCVAACAALVVLSSSARAAMVYEGFDYAPGANALNSKNGGNGFAAVSGAWGTQGADVVAGSFSYTDVNGKVLATSGNRAFMDAVDPTQLAPPATGAAISPIRTIAAIPGTPGTIYLSFLAK